MTEQKKTRPRAEIVQKDSPILRKTARPVPKKDFGSKKLGLIIAKMKKVLDKEEDGVALAAPQIGESLRIFIVSRKIFDESKNIKEDLVFINPEITKLSRKKAEMEEGCLSVRWYYGRIKRSEKAVLQAYDERGQKFKMGAGGLLAQIFQHEVDHLDGILFIDKATDLRNMPPIDNPAK